MEIGSKKLILKTTNLLNYDIDMKGVLNDEIDSREIGESGFAQENLILSNIDEIITHNKVTTNQSNG